MSKEFSKPERDFLAKEGIVGVKGLLFPSFLSNPDISHVQVPKDIDSLYYCTSEYKQFHPSFYNIVPSIERSLKAVVRGFGYINNVPSVATRPNVKCTMFFVAPNVLAGSRHIIMEGVEWWITLDPSDYVGEHVDQVRKITLLYQPPKDDSETGKDQSDFSFWTVEGHTSEYWLLPHSTPSLLKENNIYTIGFNSRIAEGDINVDPKLKCTFEHSGLMEIMNVTSQSVAPGVVRAAPRKEKLFTLDKFICYKSSNTPGSSGSPGFFVSDPTRFAFIHYGISDKCKRNLGIPVDNPNFVAAYKAHVEPHLTSAKGNKALASA